MSATRTRSFRFTTYSDQRLKKLAERWKAENENEANEMALLLAWEVSGEAEADANSAMDGLTRVYGDDEPDTNMIPLIGGKRLEGWTAGMIGPAEFSASGRPVTHVITSEGKVGKIPRLGTVHIRHDASGTFFAVGQIEDPEIGSEISVRVGDLVEHLVLRTEGKNPANLRRSIRRDLALRRKLRAAMEGTDLVDPDTEGGPPLDD